MWNIRFVDGKSVSLAKKRNNYGRKSCNKFWKQRRKISNIALENRLFGRNGVILGS
jgi:hypothetical protein